MRERDVDHRWCLRFLIRNQSRVDLKNQKSSQQACQKRNCDFDLQNKTLDREGERGSPCQGDKWSTAVVEDDGGGAGEQQVWRRRWWRR
ncbi:hypothetical protein Scep_014253 [Stephania cephalantha]|uniref:Uncharacterized protein n=1 Tax=Stephania cephalantha TaxID=152367 RepID=A0AAP0NZ83_9MAGN